MKIIPAKGLTVNEVEKLIDEDPYYSACYEAESGRNPLAKNPNSTASGGFQFLKGTARLVGLDDPFDLGASFEAVQILTQSNLAYLSVKLKRFFKDTPKLRYSAHYLGAPLLAKHLRGEAILTEKEDTQVLYLEAKALPRFMRIYSRLTADA